MLIEGMKYQSRTGAQRDYEQAKKSEFDKPHGVGLDHLKSVSEGLIRIIQDAFFNSSIGQCRKRIYPL